MDEEQTSGQATTKRALPKRTVQVVAHLQDWRHARRLTQDELAKRSKVARATIERAEQGTGVTRRVLYKLAGALEISVVQLQHEDPRFKVQQPLASSEGK